MHLLILGGSASHLGGVEAFCERSAEALFRREPNWRIHRIATETAYLTPGRIPVILHGLRALVRYRRQKPDVAWVQYVNLPDLAYVFLAWLLGMRVMVTPHLGSNWRSQRNPLLRWLSGSLLGLADRLALISKTQQLEIALPAGTPRSLIRNFLPETVLAGAPVDTAMAEPALQLIHSARLSADKGTFMVVEVSARLRDAGIPFITRITGGADQATYAELDRLIAHHGLADQVKVLGRVPEADLLAALRGSDVLIHLSRIDSYPLILLEAMACSMLPVAMELAGARDMIETYDGHVVSQEQPVEETAAFLIAADLADLRARGRAEARRVREDYSWDRCAGALAAALTACVAGSKVATEPAPV
jgi:glycosyltransferase involved in cell wall biosynthesis